MLLETRTRTLAKTLTWRIFALATTVSVLWFWTRRFTLAFAVGGAEALGKMVLYYLHERGWTHVRFGKRFVSPAVIWVTGFTGGGKTTLARTVQEALVQRGLRAEHLDGRRVRDLFPTTGFAPDERREHVRRVGTLASILESNGTFVVASFVSPHADARDYVRSLCRTFIEVHVSTPLEECEKNDTTGLYARCRKGEIAHVVGIDEPYEAPRAPEVRVDLSVSSREEGVRLVLDAIAKAKPRAGTPDFAGRARKAFGDAAAGDSSLIDDGRGPR